MSKGNTKQQVPSLYGEKKQKKLPSTLFKYYRFDSNYNEKRLSGQVFLSNPILFNDPYDCSVQVNNNTSEKIKQHGAYGNHWLKGKLIELGYSDDDLDKISKLLVESDKNTIDGVWRNQLEKLGILCLTKSCDYILMWGYYTNNEGFCIEYDFQKLLHDCVIGYINNLSFKLTQHLFETKSYSYDYTVRCNHNRTINIANDIFNITDVSLIKNEYLLKKDEINIYNFIYNIFCKRFGFDNVSYSNDNVINRADLFFDNKLDNVMNKYYTKSKEWEHEKEFRIVYRWVA